MISTSQYPVKPQSASQIGHPSGENIRRKVRSCEFITLLDGILSFGRARGQPRPGQHIWHCCRRLPSLQNIKQQVCVHDQDY